MMLRRVIFATLGLLPGGCAWASMTTCPMGTYSQYLAPGFTCQSGGLVFQNFNYIPMGSAIPASAVTVIPITTTSDEGFHFQGAWSVRNNALGQTTFQDAQIAFNVSAMTPAIQQLQLSFIGTSTGTGSSMVTESFDAGLLGSGTNTATDPLPSVAEVVFFSPAQMISITNDVTVVSGTNGTANISDVFETFVVPEPLTLLMVGAGLFGVGLIGKRAKR